MNPAESQEQDYLQALELREAQLAAIVQSVTPALISVDEAQIIVLFNSQAETVFRCTAAQAIGTSLERFIPVAAREAHRRHVANYDKLSEQGARTMGADRILTGLRADGVEFPIEAAISRSQFGGRKLFTVVLRDVTERVHQQELLQLQSDIIASASDAIMSRDKVGTILSWNRAATDMFGYSAEEAIGSNVRMLFPNAAPADHIDLAQRAIRGESVIKFPTRRRRKDGSEFDVEVTISPIRGRNGTIIGTSAIYAEVTERRRNEMELRRLLADQQQAEAAARESRDRLRELSSALQTIREEEKTRIAREIHDELGQTLTALKMDIVATASDVESAVDLPSAQYALAKRMDSMKQLIDGTVMSVRRIAADLRPVMLDNLGLVSTLEWLAKDFATRTHIQVELKTTDHNLDLSGDAATAIYRIAQEALTNVARHSGATQVIVEVYRDAGTVVLRLRDNGKGIATQNSRGSRSFGLLGMHERAFVLGGNLVVSSAPNAGTLVEAVIPAFGTTKHEGTP